MLVQSLGQENSLEVCMQSTPVFLPGESHGERSLLGCMGSLSMGHKESDTTDMT